MNASKSSQNGSKNKKNPGEVISTSAGRYERRHFDVGLLYVFAFDMRPFRVTHIYEFFVNLFTNYDKSLYPVLTLRLSIR